MLAHLDFDTRSKDHMAFSLAAVKRPSNLCSPTWPLFFSFLPTSYHEGGMLMKRTSLAATVVLLLMMKEEKVDRTTNWQIQYPSDVLPCLRVHTIIQFNITHKRFKGGQSATPKAFEMQSLS